MWSAAKIDQTHYANQVCMNIPVRRPHVFQSIAFLSLYCKRINLWTGLLTLKYWYGDIEYKFNSILLYLLKDLFSNSHKEKHRTSLYSFESKQPVIFKHKTFNAWNIEHIYKYNCDKKDLFVVILYFQLFYLSLVLRRKLILNERQSQRAEYVNGTLMRTLLPFHQLTHRKTILNRNNILNEITCCHKQFV